MAILRERTIDFGNDYKNFFYKKSGIEEFGDNKFKTLDGALEVFDLAKQKLEGDDSPKANKAFLYLYKVVERMALGYFWKFLGPNPKSQQIRIQNGDDFEYLSMCTDALYDALEAFDPTKAKTPSELKSGFQYYFRGYIKAKTMQVNKERSSHGISGYSSSVDEEGNEVSNFHVVNPDSYEMDGNKNAWDSMGAENIYDDIDSDFGDDEFKASWKALAADPELHKKNKQWNKILAAILKGKSVEDIAKEFDVAKNTIREKFFSTTRNRTNGNNGLLDVLLKKYKISQEDLAEHLHNDLGFIINTLNK